MKRQTLVVSCIAMASVGLVSAQDFVEMSSDDVVLVERYSYAIPAQPVIEEHMTLRPGSRVPQGVPLTRFEKVPSLDRYAFFVSVDHKIVVTDPRTRMVLRILDQKL